MRYPRRALPALLLLPALALVPASSAWGHGPGHDRGHDVATVTTDVETPVLYDDDEGGNASGDDPAIWVHPDDADGSLVLATAKEGGLRVYDTAGDELQALAADPAPRADGVAGRYNNVDLAFGLTVGGETLDVAVVSDRYNDQLRLFAIDPDGADADTPLTEITAPEQPFLFQPDRAGVGSEQTAYGLAVWQDGADAYAVVTQEGTTRVATARLVPRADGTVGYADVEHLDLPASFDLPGGTTWTPCEEPGVGPQLEGLSVDQRTGTLYAAQEDVGLWRLALPLGSGEPRLVDEVTDFGVQDAYDPETEECAPADGSSQEDAVAANPFGGDLLTADAEGVDVYHGPGRTGYVIVSSQGDDTYAVYSTTGRNRALGSFRVAGTGGVDDVNGSDGLAVTHRPVGDFEAGLLVTHDEPETGADVEAGRGDATGFSYVGWDDVADALDLVVGTRAGNDPRFR
ncbi:phytase [Krasilnikoviella flava]|uniref:3-phytase n=1 Tax=Krasilnikoviella flava TaxID=526729 RepID=A0A1T5J5T6_9MICO|nr:phytase [Krasilnikoviella flava]SKC46662.1 3-phytase [Krasilnikoviella flava]